MKTEALALAKVEFSSKNTDFYQSSGEFLPLAAWATKGWDVEKIAANSDPDDVYECPKFGTLYRVPIVSSGSNRETVAQGRLELLAGSRRRALKRNKSTDSETNPVVHLAVQNAAESSDASAIADAPPEKQARTVASK